VIGSGSKAAVTVDTVMQPNFTETAEVQFPARPIYVSRWWHVQSPYGQHHSNAM